MNKCDLVCKVSLYKKEILLKMRLSTLFIGSLEFNEWHLKKWWIIFLFKNASIRKHIWTIYKIYMNPRLFFLPFSWRSVGKKFLLSATSDFPVSTQGPGSLGGIKLCRSNGSDSFFSQLRIVIPIWKYHRTSKHLHITRFCEFTEYS